jgi:hypothetical protein
LSLSFVIFNLLFVIGGFCCYAASDYGRTTAEVAGGGSESGFGGSIDQVLPIAKKMPDCIKETRLKRDVL